jgi:hypothetical protein
MSTPRCLWTIPAALLAVASVWAGGPPPERKSDVRITVVYAPQAPAVQPQAGIKAYRDPATGEWTGPDDTAAASKRTATVNRSATARETSAAGSISVEEIDLGNGIVLSPALPDEMASTVAHRGPDGKLHLGCTLLHVAPAPAPAPKAEVLK